MDNLVHCFVKIHKHTNMTTPDFRNMPSTTNLKEEEIVDALGNDGNASMPEQVNRPNPWRKMMMMTMTTQAHTNILAHFFFSLKLRPNVGHGLLILEVSRSHTMMHHSR